MDPYILWWCILCEGEEWYVLLWCQTMFLLICPVVLCCLGSKKSKWYWNYDITLLNKKWEYTLLSLCLVWCVSALVFFIGAWKEPICRLFNDVHFILHALFSLQLFILNSSYFAFLDFISLFTIYRSGWNLENHATNSLCSLPRPPKKSL